jgi:hypothetical protein
VFAPVYGGISPDSRYNARYDLNIDGKVSGSDLLKFAAFFGKHSLRAVANGMSWMATLTRPQFTEHNPLFLHAKLLV